MRRTSNAARHRLQRMDENDDTQIKPDSQPVNEDWQPPELRDDGDQTVGADGEPVGEDNIRDGTVRGTMHGGPSASQGQGQGG
jgi:hypothetical protein